MDGARATLKSPGPIRLANGLRLRDSCWDDLLRTGRMHLAAAADGVSLGSSEFPGPDARFEESFALPAALVGRPSIEITHRPPP